MAAPPIVHEDGPLIHALGFHAGLKGHPRSSNPYLADLMIHDKSEIAAVASIVWSDGWSMGSSERDELDDTFDISGVGSLFDPRD